MNKKLLIILMLFSLILTSGFGCRLESTAVQKAMEPITLNFWRVYDGPDAFEEIIKDYNAMHPYITINYKKLRYDEYEKELLDSLAEDRGPDIFCIHNTWMRKYQNKLAPMPDKTTTVYPTVQGTIKKEVVNELRTSRSLTIPEIKNLFVDVVYDDAVIPVVTGENGEITEKVYALPLSVDTLAMFYNKNLFNNAGVAEPPAYWNSEFQSDVKKLTRQDGKGNIKQAGTALGGSSNIARQSDILSILMMQNGAVMMDDGGKVLFDQVPDDFRDQHYNPGLEALRFYTDFADPSKEVYSWNKSMENSLDLFMKGQVGMMFGYSYFIPQIKAQAPKLNYGISKLPQIEGNDKQANMANYWLEGVSAKSLHVNEAWDFVQFMTRETEAKKYLAITDKPTALRSLVNGQIENKEADVFAEQILTAKSWYRGVDVAAMEKIFANLTDAVIAGEDRIENSLSLAARQVQQTMTKRDLTSEE